MGGDILMADYTARIITSNRYEWSSPAPAPWGEGEKAFNAAERTFKQQNGRDISYEDDIRVEPGDDAVILFFVVEVPVNRKVAEG
jgi:hypothetical protein